MELLEAGATLKRTSLTEQFQYADYRTEYGDRFMPLMAIRGTTVSIATVSSPLDPQPGWTLVSLAYDNGGLAGSGEDTRQANTSTAPASLGGAG